MDEFLIEGSGSGRGGIVKYAALIASGALIVASLISLVVWSVSLGALQRTLAETEVDVDLASENFNKLDYIVRKCPINTTQVNDSCVVVVKEEATYEAARKSCLKINGDLLATSSQSKFENIVKFLKDQNIVPQHWVGGQYNFNHGKWEWVNGQEIPLDDPKWGSNQPQVNSEHCVVMDDDYRLHDYPCTHTLKYLCSIPPLQ